jgi:FtsP/CotA-like multicopper oxidase with cupredoxin domain
MKRIEKNTNWATIAAVCALACVSTGISYGAEFFLRADVTTKSMPDGDVAMWGFALDSSFGAGDGEVTVPGPILTVAPGDDLLIVHLDNNLTAAATGADGGAIVSLVIPGQTTSMEPVRWGATPYPQFEGRIRSATHETDPGNTEPVDYIWDAFRPGAYVYQSGTQPQVQVQMGLYGAIEQDAAPGEAYPGIAYDNEALLLYSEIDPALHAAVAENRYGPDKEVTSTVEYMPKYFLINGEVFSGDPLDPGTAPVIAHPVVSGERLLVRFLSAGLIAHSPTLNGGYMTLVAEDGNTYPYPKEQYSTLLAAGKTVDAILEPNASGMLAIYDRALHLTNNGASNGGMYAYLDIDGTP